jgi:hypothetical protein
MMKSNAVADQVQPCCREGSFCKRLATKEQLDGKNHASIGHDMKADET